jgi:hypothetical protein
VRLRRGPSFFRKGVSFETLTDHLRYFLRRLSETTLAMSVCLSFVLMKSNVRECRALVQLAHSLKGSRDVNLHVSFDLLNRSENEAYNHFFDLEWIDITDETAQANLLEAASMGRTLGIETFYCGIALPHVLAHAL